MDLVPEPSKKLPYLVFAILVRVFFFSEYKSVRTQQWNMASVAPPPNTTTAASRDGREPQHSDPEKPLVYEPPDLHGREDVEKSEVMLVDHCR